MSPRVLIPAAVLALLAALFAFRASAKMPDFEVYWRAGARALAAEPLYRDADEHYQLKYLPAFAILAIPAGLLPLTPAKMLWFVASSGLIAVLLGFSLRLLPERRKPAWVLVAVTFVAMAKFYGHELILGQVNLLFAVIIVSAVLLLEQRRSALAAAAGGVAVALVIPAVIYGVQGAVDLHREWWRTVTGSTAPNLLNPDNVSLAAMFAKWIGPGLPAAWLTAALSLVLLASAALVVRRRREVSSAAGLEAALLLMLIPLLSPQGWDYVFLIATPAIVFFVNHDLALPRALRAATWLALVLAGFSLFDIMGRAAYGRFMAWSVVSVCFLVLVAALATIRARRGA